MKQGRTLQELAMEIAAQANAKRDYIANTKMMEMLNVPKNGIESYFKVRINEIGDFRVKDLTHRQIGDRVGIPAKYYDKMRWEAPELLQDNVNHWLRNRPEDRMIRTLDGNARAFLSNRYRRLDNYDLMEAIMPTLAEIPQLKLESCDITESRLYIKAVTPRTEGEISPGDVVNAGIVITNSEVGHGAFKVEPMIYRLVCKNGMIAADYSMQKYHVGKTVSAEDEVMELYSDETLTADDRAFWLKARDIVKGSLSDTIFKTIVSDMREAKEQKIQGNPQKATQELSNRFSLTQCETSGIMRYLIEGGDLSKLGMANAITRHSQDVDDYDRATDLERVGGKVIALNSKEWKPISEAV